MSIILLSWIIYIYIQHIWCSFLLRCIVVHRNKTLHPTMLDVTQSVLYDTDVSNVHPQVLKNLLALSKTELSVQLDGQDTLWGETGVFV